MDTVDSSATASNGKTVRFSVIQPNRSYSHPAESVDSAASQKMMNSLIAWTFNCSDGR